MDFEAKMGTIVTVSGESIWGKNEKALLAKRKSKLVGFIENLPIHFQPYSQNQAVLALFLIEGLPVKTMMRLTMNDLEMGHSDSATIIRIQSEYRFLELQEETIEYLKSYLSDRTNTKPTHSALFVLTPRIAYRQLQQMGAYRLLRKIRAKHEAKFSEVMVL